MAVKFATFGLPMAVTVYEVTQGALEFVILLAAAMAASAVLYRGIRKLSRAVEVMLASPDWQKGVDHSLAEISAHGARVDERLDRLEGHVDVIAQAEHHRVKDAIARAAPDVPGERRAPTLDRRDAA